MAKTKTAAGDPADDDVAAADAERRRRERMDGAYGSATPHRRRRHSRPRAADDGDACDGEHPSNSGQEEEEEEEEEAVIMRGLYPNFSAAACVLRIARELGELDFAAGGGDGDGDAAAATAEEGEALDAFFRRLDDWELGRRRRRRGRETTAAAAAAIPNNSSNCCYVVAVEGLDGSGKSSLVADLASRLNGGRDGGSGGGTNRGRRARAYATPPVSLDGVRPIFDRRGGMAARAFYMVGNYLLLQDIEDDVAESDEDGDDDLPFVAFVDRWYGSTCAYSVAWKNTWGDPSSSDDSFSTLPESLFEWPGDLPQPNLLLILQVDEEVRRRRVRDRAMRLRQQNEEGGGSGEDRINPYNPWDDRLDADEYLGRRIMACFDRIRGGPTMEKAYVDANVDGLHRVVANALNEVLPRYQRHFEPWVHFSRRPLDYFRQASASLGYCDLESGRRGHHQPWAIQLATAMAATHAGSAPALRTVGIHTANAAGVCFFTWGHPAGARGPSGGANRDYDGLPASAVWVGGSYPAEQQWRIEGVLLAVGRAQCDALDIHPPPSLVAQISACHRAEEEEEERRKEAGSSLQEVRRRLDRPEKYAGNVAGCRASPNDRHQVRGTCLVPLRMEVLIGGPSSPGGPRRFEWTRSFAASDASDASENAVGADADGGWTPAREILPFTSPSGIVDPPRCRGGSTLFPVTLAVTGTHCSGKSTVAGRLAEALGWDHDVELGDVLRDSVVVAGGHRTGDGSGADNADRWDDLVFRKEAERDAESSRSRVVETWHAGNLGWALLRRLGKASSDEGGHIEQTFRGKARSAINSHLVKASVLWVHLSIPADVSERRHQADESNARRIPMDEKEREDSWREMHAMLETKTLDELRGELKHPRIPLLVLDNAQDGQDAVEQTVRRIVEFVWDHQWRRALDE